MVTRAGDRSDSGTDTGGVKESWELRLARRFGQSEGKALETESLHRLWAMKGSRDGIMRRGKLQVLRNVQKNANPPTTVQIDENL
jgi:hypothetical protein